MLAGIQAMKLEELERRLRTDIMQEAIAWAGRVMLHREVSLDTPAAREINFQQAATPSKRLLQLNAGLSWSKPLHAAPLTLFRCIWCQLLQTQSYVGITLHVTRYSIDIWH